MVTETLFDTTPRNPQGVKKRLDKQGDAWADQHRRSTPKDFYLQDVDAMFGAVVFGHNTGEKLFLEYVPDNYVNRDKRIRKFGVVAIFDRKTSEQAAFSNHNMVSCALYLWLCRSLGELQPSPPKFFYVIGNQEPPWTMIEVDTTTGMETGTRKRLDGSDWRATWETLGLASLRHELVQWLQG